MNDNWNMFFTFLIIIIVFGGLIYLGINFTKKYNEKWEGVCLDIGEKKQLDYYEFETCNFNSGCSIRCKFTDEKGYVVIEEVA